MQNGRIQINLLTSFRSDLSAQTPTAIVKGLPCAVPFTFITRADAAPWSIHLCCSLVKLSRPISQGSQKHVQDGLCALLAVEGRALRSLQPDGLMKHLVRGNVPGTKIIFSLVLNSFHHLARSFFPYY